MTDLLQTAIADMEQMATAVWYDVGPHLTCSEADTLDNLFIALGLLGHANALAGGHAEGDVEGDEHYQEPA